MELSFLIKGLLLGLSLGAPIGPIGALCIRRALIKKPVSGLVSQLGAASVDGMYSLIAGFSITAVSQFLFKWEGIMKFTGALFLLYLGIKQFWHKPSSKTIASSSSSLLQDYGSTFLLTIGNPTTILTFSAMFAGLGLASASRNYLATMMLTAGVVIGSALWGVCFMVVAKWFGHAISPRVMKRINIASSLVMIGFGLASLWSLIQI